MGSLVKATAASQMGQLSHCYHAFESHCCCLIITTDDQRCLTLYIADPQIWPNARVPTIKIDEEVLSPVVDVSGIDPVVGSDNSVRPSIPGRSSASLHSLSEDQKNHEQSLRPRFLERARSITFSDPETLPIENVDFKHWMGGEVNH